MGGMSGQDIYNKIHSGPGTAKLDAAHAGANNALDVHKQLQADITAWVNKMADAWQGAGATAAQASVRPLIDRIGQSHDDLNKAQDLINRQSGSFHDVKNAVKPVPPNPSAWDMVKAGASAVATGGAGVVFGAASMAGQFSNHISTNNHNVDMYNQYAGASTYNKSNMPMQYGSMQSDQAGVTVAPPPPPPPPPGGQPYGGYSGRTGTSNPPSRYGNGSRVGGPGYSYTPGRPGSASGYSPGGASGQPGGGAGWQDPGGPVQNGAASFGPGGSPGSGFGPGGFGPGGSGYDSGGAGGSGDSFGGFGGGGFGPGGESSGGSGGFGRGGSGSGAGGSGSSGFGPKGSGGASGFGPASESAPGRGGMAAGMGAAGKGGASGQAGMGAGGGKGKGDEDGEHRSASYLQDDYSGEIVGDLGLTAPPVIGG